LALAEEDESTPAYVADALLTIAGTCTAPERGPHGNKPKPVTQVALNELARSSRSIEQQRRTLTHQRHLQITQEKRRRRQLSKRAQRAKKHKKRQEERLAGHAGGQDLHSDNEKRDKDLQSSKLREQIKAARNTVRQHMKNKKDAVRTEQERKAKEAEKRRRARERR
jgi:hypothetical protein